MDLITNQTWWNGPSFLYPGSEKWPDLPTNFEVESANAELIKNSTKIVHALVNTSEPSIDLESIVLPERYSTRLKLLRVTALVVQFVDRLKLSNRNEQCLTAESISRAE